MPLPSNRRLGRTSRIHSSTFRAAESQENRSISRGFAMRVTWLAEQSPSLGARAESRTPILVSTHGQHISSTSVSIELLETTNGVVIHPNLSGGHPHMMPTEIGT